MGVRGVVDRARAPQANTKPCPGCKRNIEKDNGCNHMTCRKPGGCGFEFCWLCLGDWREHGSATGGFYQCNKYKPGDAAVAKRESERERSKGTLARYMFYFERWMNHGRSMRIADETQRDAVEATRVALADTGGIHLERTDFWAGAHDGAGRVCDCAYLCRILRSWLLMMVVSGERVSW